MVVYYIFKSYLSYKFNKKFFKYSDVYKGFNLYYNTRRKERKNFLLMFFELERLCIYWKCFPDVYFRFGMFLKSYTDYSLMKTFLPQSAYAKIIANRYLELI